MPVAHAAVVVLCCVGATQDLLTRRIPNAIPLAIAGLFLPVVMSQAVTGALSLSALATAVGLAALVFGAGVALFAAGMLGGADVKVLGAVCLWITPEALPTFLFLVVVSGGVVALGVVAYNLVARIRLKKQRLGPPGLTDGKGNAPTVPYGLAIAAGVVVMWWRGGLSPFSAFPTL